MAAAADGENREKTALSDDEGEEVVEVTLPVVCALVDHDYSKVGDSAYYVRWMLLIRAKKSCLLFSGRRLINPNLYGWAY